MTLKENRISELEVGSIQIDYARCLLFKYMGITVIFSCMMKLVVIISHGTDLPTTFVFNELLTETKIKNIIVKELLSISKLVYLICLSSALCCI